MKPLDFKTHSVAGAKHETSEAEVFFYEEIGYWGIDAKMFADTLQEIGDVDRIVLRLNSPGGDAFDGVAIFNSLVSHPAAVTVRVDSLAASAASLVAMAGDRIEMAENAFLMIHAPWTVAMGNADELRSVAKTLEKLADSYAGTYASRRKLSADEVGEMLADETWLNASEAVEAGFADEVLAVPAVAASVARGRYQHTPAALLSRETYEPPAPKWRLAAAERKTRLTELRRGA